MGQGTEHESAKVADCYKRGVETMERVIEILSRDHSVSAPAAGGPFPRHVDSIDGERVGIQYRPQRAMSVGRYIGDAVVTMNGKGDVIVTALCPLDLIPRSKRFPDGTGGVDAVKVVEHVKASLASILERRAELLKRVRARDESRAAVARSLEVLGLGSDPDGLREVRICESGEVSIVLTAVTAEQVRAVIEAARAAGYRF